MFKLLKQTRAQLIGEYSLSIFIVLTVIFAMSMIVKRALQGRMIDTRDSMVSTIDEYEYSGGGFTQLNYSGPIYFEYEPYYANMASTVDRQDYKQRQLLEGLSSGIYRETVDQRTQVQAESQQAPPKEAK